MCEDEEYLREVAMTYGMTLNGTKANNDKLKVTVYALKYRVD